MYIVQTRSLWCLGSASEMKKVLGMVLAEAVLAPLAICNIRVMKLLMRHSLNRWNYSLSVLDLWFSPLLIHMAWQILTLVV